MLAHKIVRTPGANTKGTKVKKTRGHMASELLFGDLLFSSVTFVLTPLFGRYNRTQSCHELSGSRPKIPATAFFRRHRAGSCNPHVAERDYATADRARL